MLCVHGSIGVAHSHYDGLAEVVVVKAGTISNGRHAHRGRHFYHKVQLDHPELE